MASRHEGSRWERPREHGLTTLERRVAQRIAERETELVELLRSLINFDTVTHSDGAPARQEAELQQLLAARLERCGAEARLVEPDRAAIGDRLIVPEGFSFAGRPQLVARFAGAGGGRTLLLNGHIDVVDAEPYAAWSSDPFVASVHRTPSGGEEHVT